MGEPARPLLPPAGEHGGDGARLARSLGILPGDVLDLSASLNPLAPSVAELVRRRADEVTRYPDGRQATEALARVMGVETSRLLLTNGGSEAIALVATELRSAVIAEPEFSLWRRHLASVLPLGSPGAGRVRSNPNNPTGTLAGADEVAAVWDEAFYPLATGRWTRGDADRGAVVVGSLTKLFACPGLRIGYLLAPDEDWVQRIRRRQPAWSVNSLALALMPELVENAPLPEWAQGIGELRAELVRLLEGARFRVVSMSAPWVLVESAGWLRPALARQAILVRDCSSFGMADWVRIAVPSEAGLARFGKALEVAASIGPCEDGVV